MTIILACVAYATLSYGTLNTMTLEYPPNHGSSNSTYDVDRASAQQSCTAYKSVEDATLSAYRKDGLDSSLRLYRVHTDSLEVEKIPTPTVRIVVEGQK